jgi:hypothetical protein
LGGAAATALPEMAKVQREGKTGLLLALFVFFCGKPSAFFSVYSVFSVV